MVSLRGSSARFQRGFQVNCTREIANDGRVARFRSCFELALSEPPLPTPISGQEEQPRVAPGF